MEFAEVELLSKLHTFITIQIYDRYKALRFSFFVNSLLEPRSSSVANNYCLLLK